MNAFSKCCRFHLKGLDTLNRSLLRHHTTKIQSVGGNLVVKSWIGSQFQQTSLLCSDTSHYRVSKDDDITGWLASLEHPNLPEERLLSVRRPTLFAILTFLTGWGPETAKPGIRTQFLAIFWNTTEMHGRH